MPKNLATVALDNPDWKLHKPPLPSFSEYMKKRWPREWQRMGVEALHGCRLCGIIAPCGCGKTTFQIFMSILDMVDSNFTQAQLIPVPQLHIGFGFVKKQDFQFDVDGPVYKYMVSDSENFTRDFSSLESKMDALEHWMCLTSAAKRGACKDPDSFRGLVAVCSNALLVAVFDRLVARTLEGSAAERKAARARLNSIPKNTTFRPDEMHHIASSDESDINGLGRFYRFLFASRCKSYKVCYSTATPFRGDCQKIFPDDVQFTVYEHKWLDNWKTLGIRSFKMEYTEYNRDPVQMMLDAVAQEPNRYHLLPCPRTGEAWRKGAKGEKLLRKLIKGLKALKPGRICDLVIREGLSASERDFNKHLLLEDNEALQRGDAHAFDIVVACDIVREGTDWVICDRIHESAPKKSITNNIQTMGRMFRSFHGKTTVKYVAYIPKFVIPKGCSSRAELLGHRTRILLFFLIVDNLAYPCMLPSMKTKSARGESDPDATTIEDMYGHEVYQRLLGAVLEEYRCAPKPEGLTDMEHIVLFIEKLLVQYNTPEEHMQHAADHFKLKLLNLFGAKKIRVACYKELAEFLKKYGEVLFERIDKDKTTHYGSFSEKELKKFYEICKDWRDEFWDRKRIRPSNA
ncbi:hypothetical protein LCGC14_0244390 [marine sediment metagenome]|uniref:Helicase/UvrB N-terminal domain-containing protein n=1 Tax=marine sediment metagenome TaxID=412755 RepID=A0A0F9UMX0_9ZZZZ